MWWRSSQFALSVDSPDCKALQDAWQARAEVRGRLSKVTESRADFEKCRDIHGRILIKRQAFALGYTQLAAEMLTKLVPPHNV